ncbi:TolC family protein [Algoriphagus boritolerans]|uniref:Outer membrane protein n=1 Tax=Algoriphagus boritolerans DSM 17298 = JCM 18970 TaxID=1120964 RepID=A0A1H5TYR2_9BACT|nr:TolC family protein [Algoriphagus boritolerans]SEF67909.1 outer membrane protein [Algoriphagus boritolerans DSM 17298 = JCM 18970]
MKKIFLGIILVISACSFSRAQDGNASQAYELQTCIDIALENNLTLRRTLLNQGIVEADLLATQGSRLPSITAFASSGYRWGRSINPVTNLFETRRIGNINTQVNSNMPIFNGFQITNSIAQARKNYESGQFSLQAAENDITLNIINLFIDVVFNREQLKIAENQLKTTTDQFSRTKALVEAGSLPLSDQLDLQSQNATNQVNLINAQNGLRLAKLALSQAMVIPFTDDFDVVEPDYEVSEQELASDDPSEIYEIAVSILPQIKAAEADVESAEYGVKIAKGSFMPSLGVGVAIFSNYVDQAFLKGTSEIIPFRTQIDNNLSQSANLQLSIPIFSQFSNKANLQRAKVQKQLAEVAEQEARNTLRQQIETAFTQALAAEQSYEASLLQVKSLEETFRISQQQFDFGAINSVDFQVAQNNLFNAQADLINAKYSYIFRVKVLDFYLGNPLNLN